MAILSRAFQRRGWQRVAWLAGLLGMLASALAQAPKSAPPLQVKAAFLLNFAAFVTWPEQAFPTPDAPIVLGIYGADPFGTVLNEMLAGEAVNGRPFTVRRIRPGGDTQGCHILFVSDSERARWPAVLGAIARRPVLTVGNGPGFLAAGGMIELVTERGRIRFRINQQAATQAGITMSSKLLRLAQNARTSE